MRPKGLNELEIQKICEFDWEDSTFAEFLIILFEVEL